MSKNDALKSVKYKSFNEFYPFYLSQHANALCRMLHFIGSTVVLMILTSVLISGQYP